MTLRRSLLLAAALLVILPCAAGADPATDGMAAQPAAHAPKTLKVLTPDQVDPASLLPAPAADGAERQKAELAEVERIYRNRTPERYAQAQWDNDHESSALFAATLGDGFDLAKLPATARLLALVENEQAVSATIAKRYFKRDRPWGADPTIKPCDYNPGANPLTSYPSGHATLGYSVGYVLARLIPEKAAAIQTRADDYAYSREVCGDRSLCPAPTPTQSLVGQRAYACGRAKAGAPEICLAKGFGAGTPAGAGFGGVDWGGSLVRRR